MKMKKIIHVCLMFICLSGYQSWVQAWIDPVDFDADLGDSSTLYNRFEISNGAKYHRCDTASTNYAGNEPSICHRWGLVFEYKNKPTSWIPKVDTNDYRLPTIKELVRLFDYTNGNGLDYVVKSWLGTVSSTTWLVSSSYRDIDRNYDGGDDSEYAQVFALNALTGEVKALLPGNFKVCESLMEGAESKGLATKENREKRGRCTSSGAVQTVHAIKVEQTLLKDL